MRNRLKRMRRALTWPICAVALLLAAGACMPGCAREPQIKRQTWMSMGTFSSLAVAGPDARRVAEAAAAARDCLNSIESCLSTYIPQSDISRLNAAAGREAVELSPAAADCLRLAVHYAEISDGAFDVTVGPVVSAWGLHAGAAPARPLDAATLRDALSRVGIRHVSLSNRWARLDQAGAGIDLGGIGKGYGVDVCYEGLRGMGMTNFMVDLGGNIRCAGQPRPGEPWRIGVRNPFDRDETLGTLNLSNGLAVATSGNYERFVVIQGERYTHIIDPRTGYPIKGMAGVTVVCTNAVESDAMSTSLFVLGLEGSRAALARVPGCEALFVPDRQPMEIWVTPGFSNGFTPEPEYAKCVRELK